MKRNGFTMIELIVAMAIVAMILTLAVPKYFSNVDRTREDVLREDLYLLRDAIDKYYADKNFYPNTLDDLVTEKYLRGIPVDPFTQSSRSWVPVAPDDPNLGIVANVRSGAPNKGRDGTWLKDW